MTREAVIDRVRELAAAQVAMNPANATLESRLHEDLGYESLDDTEFLMNIEENFHVSVPDEQVPDVHTTVGDVASVLLAVLEQCRRC